MDRGAWWVTVHEVTEELDMTEFSPACWELGFQAWAQSTCPELSAQGLVPLRWGCALPSPNAPGKAPNNIHTTLRWVHGHWAATISPFSLVSENVCSQI